MIFVLTSVMSNTIPILVTTVTWLFNILTILLLVRVFLSWLPMVRGGVLVSYVHAFTEPLLAPVRKLIDRSPLGGPGMMLDFSVIIVIVLLPLVRDFLIGLLQVVL